MRSSCGSLFVACGGVPASRPVCASGALSCARTCSAWGGEAARDACQGVGRGMSHAGGLSRAVWHEVGPCIIQTLSLGHLLAGRGGLANECAY